MAEHLTNLLKGGLGTLLSVLHLGNREKVLIYAYKFLQIC